MSLEVKAGHQHERKNYSTLPLIDSANSCTSMLAYHETADMTSMKRHDWDKQRQTDRVSGGGGGGGQSGVGGGWDEA